VTNAEQREAWNRDSGHRWVEDAERRDQVLAPIGDALVAAAGPAPGERVLDVGCGCGATTLDTARAVGHDGVVAGIDFSAPMLGVAAARCQAAGLTNVDFVLGDAQTDRLAGPFDLAISRFGTMFFDDQVAAFANIAGALRPGGRLCIATWRPLAENDWLTVPGAAFLGFGTMPDAVDGPGMFAQSEPDAVIRVLGGAGFTGVGLEPVDLELTLGADVDEATDYLADSGPGRLVMETVPDHDRNAALDAVRGVLAEHRTASGVRLGAAIWIITASR
jgi:SAM-dependent methyltransferase